MPQSYVSALFENPHFNMFTLDRPTCVCNRLSAFQVVQGFSAPAGRCSSGLMLRCTMASRGSSRSPHSSMRAASAAVLIGSVHFIKLFCDLRRGTRVGVDYKSPITITITITVPIKLSITITITVVIEKAITITITIIRLRLRLQLLVYHGNDSRLFIQHVHLQYYHA